MSFVSSARWLDTPKTLLSWRAEDTKPTSLSGAALRFRAANSPGIFSASGEKKGLI
jgi:hypothetical protein